MKKNIFLFLIAACTVSSCKFSVEIAKRKYRNGHFISISTNKKNGQETAMKRTDQEKQQPDSVITMPGSSDYYGDHSEKTVPSNLSPSIVHVKQSIQEEQQTRADIMLPAFKNRIQKEEKEKHNGDYFLLLFSGFTAAVLAAALKFKLSSAKSISRWAKNNRKKTWLIFTGLHATLIPGALLFGTLLYAHDLVITPFATGILATSFITACILYPLKKRREGLFRSTYLSHKITDAAVALSGFMLLAATGNQIAAVPESRPAKLYASLAGKFTSDPEKTKVDFIYKKFIPEKKQLRDNGGAVVGKIFLLLLAIAVFALLESLVLALACNLSCSGNEGAAAVVGIGGTALLIWILVLVIRAIFKKRDPESTPQQ